MEELRTRKAHLFLVHTTKRGLITSICAVYSPSRQPVAVSGAHSQTTAGPIPTPDILAANLSLFSSPGQRWWSVLPPPGSPPWFLWAHCLLSSVCREPGLGDSSAGSQLKAQTEPGQAL